MAVRSLCLATLLAGCAAYPSRLSTFFATPRPARPHNALQPPNIRIEYATNFTMRADGTSSGMLYASQDYTLFAQTKPAALYPYQLNLGDQGIDETYVAYNPKTSICNGADPLYCIKGQSCAGKPCIALFDNPFLGLPDTQLDGLCQPSGANKWSVSNGGYTLTYCITAANEPLTLTITGAGGDQLYTFSNFKEGPQPSSLFQVPGYCACKK